MSEIKRYEPINIDGTCGICAEDADGAYVDYRDFAALNDELAALKYGVPAQDELPAGGVTIEKDVFGTVHIKMGDFDYIQIQYQYPYTDNASQNVLAKRIAELLTRPAQTEQRPWDDSMVRDFLSVALRHVEVKGTLHSQDIRDALRYMAERYAAPIAQTEQQPEQSGLADRLNSVIAELQGGFVACQRCGDQEDTATLDCVPELEAIAAALSAVTAERDGLAAARMAYASEFAPDEHGDPDVGGVHANIRALKAERDRLRDAAGKAIAWLDAEQNGSGVGINRRLKLCRDAENSLRAAMAAKEA